MVSPPRTQMAISLSKKIAIRPWSPELRAIALPDKIIGHWDAHLDSTGDGTGGAIELNLYPEFLPNNQSYSVNYWAITQVCMCHNDTATAQVFRWGPIPGTWEATLGTSWAVTDPDGVGMYHTLSAGVVGFPADQHSKGALPIFMGRYVPTCGIIRGRFSTNTNTKNYYFGCRGLVWEQYPAAWLLQHGLA